MNPAIIDDEVKAEFLGRSSGYGRGLRGEGSPGENAAAQEAFRNFRKGFLAARSLAEQPAVPVAAMDAGEAALMTSMGDALLREHARHHLIAATPPGNSEEYVRKGMELAEEYGGLKWSAAVSGSMYDRVHERQSEVEAAEVLDALRTHLSNPGAGK